MVSSPSHKRRPIAAPHKFRRSIYFNRFITIFVLETWQNLVNILIRGLDCVWSFFRPKTLSRLRRNNQMTLLSRLQACDFHKNVVLLRSLRLLLVITNVPIWQLILDQWMLRWHDLPWGRNCSSRLLLLNYHWRLLLFLVWLVILILINVVFISAFHQTLTHINNIWYPLKIFSYKFLFQCQSRIFLFHRDVPSIFDLDFIWTFVYAVVYSPK